jgi:tetratricopeptide (TPR) repeat protein
MLGRNMDAKIVLDELWKYSPSPLVPVVLSAYEAKTSVLIQFRLYEEALLVANEGLDIAINNKFLDRVLELWTLLGKTYLLLNNYDKAEECLYYALDLRVPVKRLKRESLVIATYTELAKLYHKIGEYRKSEEYFHKALATGEITNNSRRHVEALHEYEKTLIMWNRPKDAVLHLSLADKLCDESKFIRKREEVLFDLSNAYLQFDMKMHIKILERKHQIQLILKQEEVEGGVTMRVGDPPEGG